MNTNLIALYLSLISLVWLISITIFLVRLSTHYRKLTADVSKKDLITALNHFINLSQQNSGDVKSLTERLNKEIIANKDHLQRVGFKRYNPFTDTGGNQSFTLALLNENGDGIVISSLHSRENTRLYAKNLVQGKVENQSLSVEEQEVIKQALK